MSETPEPGSGSGSGSDSDSSRRSAIPSDSSTPVPLEVDSKEFWEKLAAERNKNKAHGAGDYRRKEVEEWVRYAAVTGDKSRPPDFIVCHTDILEDEWGWDRLVPFVGRVDWSIYVKYLNQYYNRNQSYLNPVPGDQIPSSLAAAAQFCLEMEERLVSELNEKEGPWPGRSSLLICSGLVQKLARPKISAKFSAAAAAAFLCIATEADVILERLKHDSTMDTLSLMRFSANIRLCALSLMDCRGAESAAAAAAMVGISKEAKSMLEWMRNPDWDFSLLINEEVNMLDVIRGEMLDMMMRIMEGSLAAAAPVHNPAKVESSGEAVHSGNGNGIADSAALESAGKNTSEKFKCEDDKRKRKRAEKKAKRQMAEAIAKERKREEKERKGKSIEPIREGDEPSLVVVADRYDDHPGTNSVISIDASRSEEIVLTGSDYDSLLIYRTSKIGRSARLAADDFNLAKIYTHWSHVVLQGQVRCVKAHPKGDPKTYLAVGGNTGFIYLFAYIDTSNNRLHLKDNPYRLQQIYYTDEALKHQGTQPTEESDEERDPTVSQSAKGSDGETGREANNPPYQAEVESDDLTSTPPLADRLMEIVTDTANMIEQHIDEADKMNQKHREESANMIERHIDEADKMNQKHREESENSLSKLKAIAAELKDAEDQKQGLRTPQKRKQDSGDLSKKMSFRKLRAIGIKRKYG